MNSILCKSLPHHELFELFCLDSFAAPSLACEHPESKLHRPYLRAVRSRVLKNEKTLRVFHFTIHNQPAPCSWSNSHTYGHRVSENDIKVKSA